MANKVMTVAIAYIFPGDSAMLTILTAILEKTDRWTIWRNTVEPTSSSNRNDIDHQSELKHRMAVF